MGGGAPGASSPRKGRERRLFTMKSSRLRVPAASSHFYSSNPIRCHLLPIFRAHCSYMRHPKHALSPACDQGPSVESVLRDGRAADHLNPCRRTPAP
ncbi:hypothetical protein GUJ93_ZPchr0003g16788 [Zizania palustris]|uniref:Uncharacterized protein n=1 Tax=Zizania palustris TaxID=103762 RepID=A0A8J5S631_ZIZPA|nr:hypothetical protein GUJ93_ZPchr0003g16788 [Zizania palustris]